MIRKANGEIMTMDEVGDAVDAWNAKAIEAASAGETPKSGSTEGESAVASAICPKDQ